MIPRASFVIPAFNADRWISKAIFSCRNQTVKQIEILVVNDGSTDETKAIIDWHAKEDPRVHPFHMERNQGRSAARNLGNASAQGDVILVLDADDLATRNRVKDTLVAFDSKKADVVYGSFFVMDSMGNAERKILSGPFDPEVAKQKKMNFICHSTMAYRKSVSKEIRYDEGVYSTLGLDDWKFQWDAHLAGYVIKHIKTPLCYYRMTEDGVSVTRDPKDVEKAKEEFLATI